MVRFLSVQFKAASSMFIATLGLALILLVTIPSAITAQAADRTTKADHSPLVPITLHLQWYHQFQFAGYYAALEQGYYREFGLDVSIIEGGPGVETFQKVVSAPGNYGTAHAAGALLQRIKGQPLVALATIFQHSPNVIIARADSGITTPHDLKGTRTVFWPGGRVEHSAMLLNEGIDPKPFMHEALGDNVKDLIDGKLDAIDGYITNEIFSVRSAGIPVNIIRPRNYGVDFYGDTLITSEREVLDHRERLDAFREASLRGWKFALDYPQEIIDLLITKYGVKKTREHLLYEAEETKKLIEPGIVKIGHMNPGRWEKMADTLVKQGMVDPGYSLKGFIYDPSAPKNLMVFLGHKFAPPYASYENEKPVGADVDLTTALGKALGRPVELRLYQWADAQARFQRGEGHALISMVISKKRQELYDFTQSTFGLDYVLFAKSQNLDQFNIRDLSNKRIAVRRGGYAISILENNHPEAKAVAVETTLEGFRMLLEGDVDGVIDERLGGNYKLKQSKIQGIEAVEAPLSKRTLHIPVIKGSSALLEEINQAISKLKSKGKIKEISRRWLGGPVWFLTRGEKNAALIGVAITLAVVAMLTALLWLAVAKRNLESKLAEKALKQSEKRFKQLFERAPLGYQSLNIDGEFIEVNQAWLDIFGYSRAEVIGHDFMDFLVEESFFERNFPQFKQRGEIQLPGTQMRCKDGTVKLIHIDGKIGYDKEGSFFQTHCILTDITERKQLEEQLIQSQKMEAVGQLTGGIAHDFNNLMGVILGNLEMAKDDKTGEERNELISNAIRAVDRGAALTQQLLSFSRKQVLNPKFTGINELVAENLKLLERTLGEDIEIETQFSEEPLPVHIDTAMFGNALLNLSLNARDAMPSGGHMTIKTEQLELKGEIKGKDDQPITGPYVRVTVSDTGCGMDKGQIARAVEPFFTTKDVGEGSGLGLSMVYGFIEQSGGHMTIDSEQGKRTNISLYIPMTGEKADEDTDFDAPFKPVSQPKTILVVEDDLDVLNTTSRILRDMGYEVIEAADGPSAGEMLVERSDEIDLLFSDMVMPKGMNGLELAEWVKGKYDHIKVLLTSGYPDKIASKDYIKSSRVTMLAKPYKKAQLAKAIDDAFDSQ